MSSLDPPIVINEPEPVEKYGLSAETMLMWLTEMVNIPKWRPQADEDFDYYETNQLKQEVAEEMERRGQAPSVIPYCSAAIDIILGMEAETRTGIKVDTAPGEVTPDVADALTVKLFEAVADTDTDAVVAEAFHGQIIGGLDWVEVGRDSDPFRPGKRVSYVPYHEMWWDWRSKNVLLRDSRYIVRKKRYDFDIVTSRWPEVAPVITALGRGSRYQTWDYPQFGEQLTRSYDVDRGLREEQFEWFNTLRKTALVYEVWYKQLTLVTVYERKDGKIIEYDENDIYQVEAARRGLIQPYEAYTHKMRVAFWVGNIRVSDDPTPYPHHNFPYIPFFAFREKRYGTPFGLMRRMRGIQEMINNTTSKIHFYMGANRTFYDERAFEDPNQVKQEINKANYFIPVKADPITGKLYEVNVQTGSQLLDPHINYLNTLTRMFSDVSGIHPATRGSQSGEMAFQAAELAREQDITGMAKVNDNYRMARRQVHELLLALVIEDLADKRNVEVEVARDIGGPRKIILNQELEDGTLANSVADVNVKVVLEATPKSETYNQQVLTALSEFLKSAPEDVQALMMPGFLRLSDLPGHNRIADLLAESVGLLDEQGNVQNPKIKQLQDQVQQLQMKLEMKQPPELLAAQVEKTKAETQKILADIKDTIASSVETAIKGMFGAVQAGQLIAGNPSITPVADSILNAAGFKSAVPTPEASNVMPLPLPPNRHPNVPENPAAPAVAAPEAPTTSPGVNPVRGSESKIEGGRG